MTGFLNISKLSRSEKLQLLKALWEKKRRKLTQNFWDYCVYMDASFFTERKAHLMLIAAVYQFVADKLLFKVLLSMPPRAGKSYITSMFCSWMIGRYSDGIIMRNSYSGDLAAKFSYDIREIVRSPKFHKVFPHVRIKSDKRALDDWAVEGSPQTTYFCAGVMGSLTGKGCDLLAILDDPIKNLDVALSGTQIDKINGWVESVHNSRMEKDCPQIHIATRWTKRDPIGEIKRKFGSVSFDKFLEDPEKYKNSWVEIVIPALDENGNSFCDEIKTTEQYDEIRKSIGNFIWSALYMQRPVDIEGLAFPETSMQFYTQEEFDKFDKSENNTWDGTIGYCDTADEGGDHLVSVIAKIKGQFAYIYSVIYTLEPIEVSEPRVAQQIIDTKCDHFTIESNAGGKSFAKNVRKLINKKSRCTIRDIDNTSNKDTRIIMKGGTVRRFFKFKKDVKNDSEYREYFNELTNYVLLSKKRDDAPDATVGLAEALDRPKLEAVERL